MYKQHAYQEDYEECGACILTECPTLDKLTQWLINDDPVVNSKVIKYPIAHGTGTY